MLSGPDLALNIMRIYIIIYIYILYTLYIYMYYLYYIYIYIMYYIIYTYIHILQCKLNHKCPTWTSASFSALSIPGKAESTVMDPVASPTWDDPILSTRGMGWRTTKIRMSPFYVAHNDWDVLSICIPSNWTVHVFHVYSSSKFVEGLEPWIGTLHVLQKVLHQQPKIVLWTTPRQSSWWKR